MKMTRRQFGLSMTAMAAIPAVPALAQGKGYETLENPIPTGLEAGRVEVLEHFWFGCPHCFAFEPSINAWAESKPDYVEFVREAPPLNPAWTPHSKAFYAAELMGVTDKMFDELFDGIHVDRKRLHTNETISKFVGTLGIDSEEFSANMESLHVDSRIRRSLQMARQARVNGVPSIIINGKFRTGNSLAGGHQGIINVINELVEQEHNA